MESAEVSIIPGLQKEEKAAVEKRSPKVLKALKKLSIQANEAPVIAMLGSGGGLRAHIACLGVLSEMREQGLLDAVMYLAAVSGSTWAMSSFYTNSGDTKAIEAELKRRFDQKEWDLDKSLEKTVKAAKLENYSLTDFWAYLVVSKQTRELQDSCLSSMKKQVEDGTLPYPIFAAIDDDLQTAWERKKAQSSMPGTHPCIASPETWFEFTPHHAGYPALGAYVPTTHFGSKFKEGRLIKSESERDLTFLKGLWGSALASTKDMKKFILAQFLSLKEKLKMNYLSKEGTGVDEALLELVTAYLQDQSSNSTQRRLQTLQQALQVERPDQDSEPEHAWLAKMVQNWSQMSWEEQGRLLESLVCSFTGQGGLPMPRIRSTIKESLKDFLDFLNKTGVCFWKWEWGTIHNFLYEHGGIRDEAMHSRELLHLVDAGVAINTPYPLVLPPMREVHLILSFDFSAGDPFETIRAAADYCHQNKIPFPPVEEAKLEAWSKAPADCYILKGETGPVVMHFPLFNTDTCGDEIQMWNDRYSTFKLVDSYTLDLVTQLLEVSKNNIRRNKENILREMRNVVRLYCWNGHAQVIAPPVLPTESTIIFSFMKMSSAQGSMGLLVHYGLNIFLIFLFSAPFSYTFHSTKLP
ncbi:Cytosolic phospholipase A2 gamma [Tupaia chinensis]|uniref:Cytosolic phospholipase A2 gamma n=1 Tax=Tupaia chinensis TaxID=246437 RepID=L9L7U9_TUPCH|nr:Cytosolic phospholipase A2 gamma [Tupaia chinensis]